MVNNEKKEVQNGASS